MAQWIIAVILTISMATSYTPTAKTEEKKITYPIVDTNETKCYGFMNEISAPKSGQDYYGQDAQFAGNQSSYKDNGDGTITDNVTGLMWVKARDSKVSWDDAFAGASKCTDAKYSDWRMPTIKELYSLIEFTGKCRSFSDSSNCIPYLDTKYFEFKYGETSKGERIIDCQDWSATTYVSTTMNGNPTAFGVNFADGRIKGYPKTAKNPEGTKITKLYVRYVRGNTEYGKNNFVDNNDKTITDKATGLMWTKDDSGKGLNWKEALAWAQQKNKEKYLGFNDWRLPNAKELESIVDYTRSPDTTKSAAIDQMFTCTKIKNEGGNDDYPFYWTNTTHLDNMGGVYVCFGRALGFMTLGQPPKPSTTTQNPPPPGDGKPVLMDVHGAGAQRSDPKEGNPADYPTGKGPQGDVIRIYNYIRLVRDIK
jgi:hypothetical protein